VDHLGAAVADAVLQAGVNYHTVVLPRVRRIYNVFPNARTLTGVVAIVNNGSASDFLLWSHAVKISRFASVVQLLHAKGLETTCEVRSWLPSIEARSKLLAIHGVGPKTYDYLSGLLGVDCLAVDRHVVSFARQAGVIMEDYQFLKTACSFAADFLGISRRDFDSWIWRKMSSRRSDDVRDNTFQAAIATTASA